MTEIAVRRLGLGGSGAKGRVFEAVPIGGARGMHAHAKLIDAMVEYEKSCPRRVHHFLKVHGFAKTIAELEGIGERQRYILEAAAIVHDIGIKPSLEKYGSSEGQLQEREGPPVARPMLQSLGYDEAAVERVCTLVSRHHTYTDIDGPDYQILVEADFLVNIYESDYPKENVKKICEEIFRTEAGKRYCRLMYEPF